ncbi:MAG: alpha/beta hydrolase [Fervidobacterium sp.]|nr:alpha/beta hydrolase [Fervidobacterium sp.]
MLILNNTVFKTILFSIISFFLLSYYNSFKIVDKLRKDAKFVKVSGIDIAYREFGKENTHSGTVVFLHGFTGSSADWGYIIGSVSKNYHCIAIDIPPFGLSGKSKEFDYSDRNIVDALIETLNKLKIEKFTLVGHSMGGYLSILISNRIPEKINSLILVDSAFNYPIESQTDAINLQISQPTNRTIFLDSPIEFSILLDIGLKIYPLLKYVYTSVVGEANVLQTKHFDLLFSQNFFLPGEILVKFSIDKLNQKIETVDFSKFLFPTLIIYGENDNVTPPKIGEFFHSVLPNSQFVLLPNEGHMPLFNETIVEKIMQFLEKNKNCREFPDNHIKPMF